VERKECLRCDTTIHNSFECPNTPPRSLHLAIKLQIQIQVQDGQYISMELDPKIKFSSISLAEFHRFFPNQQLTTITTDIVLEFGQRPIGKVDVYLKPRFNKIWNLRDFYIVGSADNAVCGSDWLEILTDKTPEITYVQVPVVRRRAET
jgi:hypothetical protein